MPATSSAAGTAVDLISSTPVLENPEHQTKWYYKYFLGKLHKNYVGQDAETKANYALSGESAVNLEIAV